MKKVFKSIGNFFSSLFGGAMKFLKQNSQVAVTVVNAIKSVVENPGLDVVVALTKTDLDNKVLFKLRALVPQVAAEVAAAHGILSGSETNSEALAKLVAHVRKYDKDARAPFWWDLVARLNVSLSDNKIGTDEALALALLVYNEFFEKRNK